MTTALVLAGHGSHISPHTAGLVWRHVDALRAMRVAHEMTAAFWKETPSFHTVLNTLTADDITIVPLFTAQGYFTRTVIPAEMGLTGSLTRREGRTIRYAHTLGEHPYLGQVVHRRVEQALNRLNLSPEQVSVALIGHGTKRNPDSRTATEAQAQALRQTALAAEVLAVYLDDVPAIADLFRLTHQPYLIAIPFFVASGSHTSRDVPAELGLPPGQSQGTVQGRRVLYTAPVGTDDALPNVILELARQAGAALRPPETGSAWEAFPAAGRDELIAAVHSAGKLLFGQLLLTPSEVCVNGDSGALETLDDPAALRTWVRESRAFRPLATACDLPGGWRVAINDPAQLHAVVETVYPGAVADWAAYRTGRFMANSFQKVIARQTGMFRQLADFGRSAELVARVCGKCVRQANWYSGNSPHEAIPCPEPCNLWLSAALESSR